MSYKHLIFDSMTSAMKAKKFLESKGVAASVVKTPEKNSRNGCSYSIKTADAEHALLLLKRAGISAKGKY